MKGKKVLPRYRAGVLDCGGFAYRAGLSAVALAELEALAEVKALRRLATFHVAGLPAVAIGEGGSTLSMLSINLLAPVIFNLSVPADRKATLGHVSLFKVK